MPKDNKSSNTKKQASAFQKLHKAAIKERNKDLVAKWKFLEKVGAYNARDTAAQIRLTDSRIRAIEKKFKQIQSMKKLVRGKTVRPAKLIHYVTPSGRRVTKYDFTPNFTFIKTKNKTKVKNGVKQTRKGVILEKPPSVKRITINKAGDIIEKIKGGTRKITRYSGQDLLRLLDKFDKNTYPFKKGEVIVFHIWGQPAKVVKDDDTGGRFISNYIRTILNSMPPDVEERFLDASYIEFIKADNDETFIEI